MTEVLKTGLSGKATFSVTPEYTAAAMGSGDLPVLATPALIAFMERTAKDSLLAHLPAGATTVAFMERATERAESGIMP